MVISSATLAAANKGFRKLYDGGLAAAGTPKIDGFAFRATSTSADETYGWLGAMPGMRKLVGEINIRNLVDHGFKVANEEYEDTVAVKRKDIERDKLGIYNGFFTAMGKSARRHPDKLLAAALVAGFTTPCSTGKNFFDADHEPQKGKGKFTNKGTKKLSAANYAAAVATLKSFRDSEGEPINDSPDLVLIVSPKNEALAKQILQSDFIQATATNKAGTEIIGTTAVSNVNKGTARLEAWNRLSANEEMWFLVDLGAVVKPFVYQVELDTEFKALTDPNSEHVTLKQEYIYQAYGRYNVAALLPELAWGSTGADAA